MPPAPQKKPSSPCTRVCVLDAAGLCLGCGRTRDEIAAWGAMPEALRLAVMAGLPARMRAAGIAPPRAQQPAGPLTEAVP